MKTVLEMIFIDTANREFIVRVPNPRDDISSVEVEQAMQEILTQDVFVSNYGDLKAIDSARIVTTQVTAYDYSA